MVASPSLYGGTYNLLKHTLSSYGIETTFVDATGQAHDWRAELVAELARRQEGNGSWVNKVDGFMEGDANLVTAYGLLALGYVAAARV